MPSQPPSTPSDYDEPVWDAAALEAIDASEAAFFSPDNNLLPVSLPTTSTRSPAHLAIDYEVCSAKRSNSSTAPSTSSEAPTPPHPDLLNLDAPSLRTHSSVAQSNSPSKKPQELASNDKSLYSRYRAKRGFLSVSDLVACAWCETQVEYGLLGQRHLKPSQRPTSIRTAAGKEIKVDTQRVVSRQKILDGGTSVHAKLEKEVAPERVEVKVTTQVDAWGLRIMNTLINLTLLRTNGMMREINVWGFVGDFLVQGVIDQIELLSYHASRPRPPSRKKPTSSNQGSLDAYLLRPAVQSIASESTIHGGGEVSNRPGVRISDSKTTQGTTLPPHAYTQSPRYQLMLYKYMYDQMASGAFDSARLATHLSLDLVEPFSPAFLRDLEPVLRSAQDPSPDQLFSLPTNLGEMFDLLQQEIAKIGVSDDRLEIVYRERGHVKKKGTTAKGSRKKKAKTGHTAQRDEADGEKGVLWGAVKGSGEEGATCADDKQLQEAIRLSLVDVQEGASRRSIEDDRPREGTGFLTSVDAGHVKAAEEDEQLQEAIRLSLADAEGAAAAQSLKDNKPSQGPDVDASPATTTNDCPLEKCDRALDDTLCSSSAVDGGSTTKADVGLPHPKSATRRSSVAPAPHSRASSLHRKNDHGEITEVGGVPSPAGAPVKLARGKRRASCAGAVEVASASQDPETLSSAVDGGAELTIDDGLPTAKRGKRRSSTARAADVEESSLRQGDEDTAGAVGAAVAVAATASALSKRVRGKRRASSAGAVAHVQPGTESTSSAIEGGAVTTSHGGQYKPVRPKQEPLLSSPHPAPAPPAASPARPTGAGPTDESAGSATLASMVSNYDRKKTGADDGVIGSLVFTYDHQELHSFVVGALEFWSGKREPRGVPITEFNRCGPCEFRSGCEWRTQKAEEIASLAIQKANVERRNRGLKEL